MLAPHRVAIAGEKGCTGIRCPLYTYIYVYRCMCVCKSEVMCVFNGAFAFDDAPLSWAITSGFQIENFHFLDADFFFEVCGTCAWKCIFF